ncbi:hypothetical protein [Mucilaginibacter terrenus]|nr:hypothetical protein [Mucilaginibacter terrenus]
MKRSLALACLLFSFVYVRAQTVLKVQFDMAVGYEQQKLDWSIAGNSQGQNPNIYSELKWKKLGGIALSAGAQWNITGRFMLMGSYSHSAISAGTVTDNDYSSDNRTNRVYNETFDADQGFSRSVAGGLGFILIDNNRFGLVPYVGYGTSKQSLHLLDRSGQFADLNSSYQTNWKGPFVKLAAVAKLLSRLSLKADFRYNQADYNAKADWNLISTFQHPVSFRHTAKGYGLEGNTSLAYQLVKRFAINLGAGVYHWETGKGIDELYLSSGTAEQTQLNSVNRSGYRLFAGVIFKY